MSVQACIGIGIDISKNHEACIGIGKTQIAPYRYQYWYWQKRIGSTLLYPASLVVNGHFEYSQIMCPNQKRRLYIL